MLLISLRLLKDSDTKSKSEVILVYFYIFFSAHWRFCNTSFLSGPLSFKGMVMMGEERFSACACVRACVRVWAGGRVCVCVCERKLWNGQYGDKARSLTCSC